MALILCGLTLTLFLTTAVIPVMQAMHSKQKKEAKEIFFLTKLQFVREYYPELQKLSYQEIADEYDVETIYDNIGRRG